ncbi:muts domain V-domain-containing protein [Geopyxis carbonaria]|nr:muts domain V-domain-containing protein [Geopyxis carbonaria]
MKKTLLCQVRTSTPRLFFRTDGRDLASKRRRRRTVVDEEEFSGNTATLSDDDFIVPDDGPTPKRKKQAAQQTPKFTPSRVTPKPTRLTSTLKSGNCTPASVGPPKFDGTPGRFTQRPKKDKEETRYSWLLNIKDLDGNTPDHPDYDPRTLYIPPDAWAKFTAFETQYWEIKCKLYDTVVFFKKGKFYELYEDDATIGHQHFDLKLTDRVNMRMVGVPESSLEMWASQFIAKGYKVARVDQRETALGKEMREKGGKASKEEKVIKRELACVLTGGTLVDEAMLQDDMSTFCVSIKESIVDDLPCYGISFVDTATGSFYLTEFQDDVDLTKFETFVAQIRPKELILEKGCLSSRATRILKNNTYLTTIWNKLKPVKEFWDGSTTIREIDSQEYFRSGEWPQVLATTKSNELLMSSFGALLCYLQFLKIDRELVSLENFSIYDPIRKASSLVLDGKTLLNMEIFTNSYDGSSTGTLFAHLNRCITPFGKRMLRQWVCHPLIDSARINKRLDAIDSINANDEFREIFNQQLSRLPDLERLISRVHAGTSRAIDFVRVIEGFEQIQETINRIQGYGQGEGLIGELLNKLPNLEDCLSPWETAFDRGKAKTDGVLVPEYGVEADFDQSQDNIESIITELNDLLKSYTSKLRCRDLRFADIGKEIYLIEVPTKAAKDVPKDWSQMSGTQKVKRFYSPEVRKLVRTLQESQETHNQIVKEVASRFYQRFDKEYSSWLSAVQIVAHLDCLVGLARASSDLGETSCRPTFVDEERTVLDFKDLRHPCMSTSLENFIPNDVKLGGSTPKLNLLTGANAAGKSTILRMACIGVIMAQIGCYVPCNSARLTPIDRIMSRLGANDNIFAAQSTFLVELSETKKILAEATPRSLVILDELGRGTSSYDGVAVAQSVLHHIATHIGCVGYFATHYHSLAAEFAAHPEIFSRRMKINVDDANRNITFLYKLEDGVAEGSFGMHCAAMCGVNSRIIARAEEAAKLFEHTSKMKDSLEAARSGVYIPLGLQSDIACVLSSTKDISKQAIDSIIQIISAL